MPPPVKAKAIQLAGKRMATLFWDSKGLLLVEWLPEDTTINLTYYISILEKLRDLLSASAEA